MRGTLAATLCLTLTLPLAAYARSSKPPTSILNEPAELRSKTWYADHPAALMWMTQACREDPGHLKDTPDCINAEAGRYELAFRHEVNAGNVASPTSPRYWIIHPDQIPFQRKICSHVAPEYEAANYCAAVQAAQSSLGM